MYLIPVPFSFFQMTARMRLSTELRKCSFTCVIGPAAVVNQTEDVLHSHWAAVSVTSVLNPFVLRLLNPSVNILLKLDAVVFYGFFYCRFKKNNPPDSPN